MLESYVTYFFDKEKFYYGHKVYLTMCIYKFKCLSEIIDLVFRAEKFNGWSNVTRQY